MIQPALYDLPDLYDRVVPPGPCERFYRDEARRADGPVLELACGTGRLTLPLARDGRDVTGLDASPAMLARAGAKAREAGLHITFVRGDMHAFALARRFALIVVSCNSLAHLTDNAALKSGLACIRRHLRPGGRLVFDIVNPDLRHLARAWSEGPGDAQGRPGAEHWLREEARYDPLRQIRIGRWRVAEGGGPERRLAPMRLRQIFPQELPLLLELSGLALTARYGDFERRPLAAGSLNQVCIARIDPRIGAGRVEAVPDP